MDATSQIEILRNMIKEDKRQSMSSKNMITELSGSQSVLCKQNLFVTHLDKNKEITWDFIVKSNMKAPGLPVHGLKNVFTLEKDCPEFSFCHVEDDVTGKLFPVGGTEISLANVQLVPVTVAKLRMKFRSHSYGHFNVSLIFDFGISPRIVRYVGVVVAPEKHLFEKLSSTPPPASDGEQNELAWLKKYKLITFDDSTDDSKEEPCSYSLPANLQFGVKFGGFDHLDVNLTLENYRDRLHNLLYVEEYERRKRMSRLNVHCDDIFTWFARKRPRHPSMRTVDVDKALVVPISAQILEEVGTLVTRGAKALLRLRQFVYGSDTKDFVLHEALVINIFSEKIVVEISSKTLASLRSMTSPVPVDICFRFVNTFRCMHSAIDRVNLDFVFYRPRPLYGDGDMELPVLPNYSSLSPMQTSALEQIMHSATGSPVLLLGPFGTGKTQTIAAAVKLLISRQASAKDRCRILICTHSNSAADHYIEDYLHPFLQNKNGNVFEYEKPLRLYWEHRLATSISDTLLPYCIMNLDTGTFRIPALEELESRSIIVTTLVTADMLIKCGVEPGFFTHIFIDEAAQAMEVETLVPLSLGTGETKVVLAGDHLQLSPPVFSSIGRKLQLDKSLLTRMYELYPRDSKRKLLLVENFRSYPEIVDIPSKLFYDGSLICKKKSPGDMNYPVHFYGVHGLEEKASDSPSYLNMAEVAEVTERIKELAKAWPTKYFGKLNLERTCVLCAHYAQIRQIRQELRMNGLSAVRVENVNNVQGLEFDVLILSTVRTSLMLTPGRHEGADLGFLSNPKLLNTAITRAKFCLVIVGDPQALCSIGDCSNCWKSILSLCSERGTFHYRVPLTQVFANIRADARQQHSNAPASRIHGSPIYQPGGCLPPNIPGRLPFLPPDRPALIRLADPTQVRFNIPPGFGGPRCFTHTHPAPHINPLILRNVAAAYAALARAAPTAPRGISGISLPFSSNLNRSSVAHVRAMRASLQKKG